VQFYIDFKHGDAELPSYFYRDEHPQMPMLRPRSVAGTGM
jgi:hypothetical protein